MRFPAKTTGTGYARTLYRVAMPKAGPAPRTAHHKSNPLVNHILLHLGDERDTYQDHFLR